MHKKDIALKYPFHRKQALTSSFTLSLIINIILFACSCYSSFRINPLTPIEWRQVFEYFIVHFLCNMLLLFTLYSFSNWLVKKGKKSLKTGFHIVVGSILLCCCMSPILSQLQWLLLIPDDVENGYSVFLGYNLAKDLILEVMMLLETGIRVSTYKRYQISVVNQSLMKENIKTRYDALKNQLDPHFLFNSLNTLNGLIGVDDDKAHEYVENLSSVFRYTLRSKTICTLDEEIEFVNSYVDLLKIRYGENLVVHYNIDERFRKYYLMPVSIQLLVENAIKHNIISNKKPLFILIESTEQGFISVKNLINLKLKNVQNNGVGLANLANRYSLLFQKTINIQNKDGFFSVEIPLIEKMDVKP